MHRRLELVLPAVVFLGIWTSYLPGHMGCSDSRWSIPTAVSLLSERNFDLDEYESLVKERGSFFTEQIDGHTYTVYPFGVSIIAAPAVALLRPFANLTSRAWPSLWMSMRDAQWSRGCPPARAEPVVELHSWTEQIIASSLVALTALLLYAIARTDLSVATSVAVALMFAFGTPAWSTASRSLWQHGPSMLVLTAALYFQRRGTGLLVLGMLLALSYVIRPTNAIPLGVCSLWVAWNHPRRVGTYVLGAALILIPFAALNWQIYDAWLSPYYQPATHNGNPFIWEALAGSLVSPGRGLFVYSPVVGLAFMGIVLKIRQRHFTTLDLTLIVCVLLYWIATAWVNPQWAGGDSYGPRLLTDIVPYLVYWLIPVVAWIRTAHGWPRRAVAVVFASLATVSVLMHAQGVFNPKAMSWNHEPVELNADPTRLWDWRHPPFLAGFVAPSVVEQLPDLRTIACTAPPTAPSGFVFAILSNLANTVSGSWNPSLGPVGFYIVESGTKPGESDLPTRETQMTTLTVTRIPPGTYYVRVRAANACGISAASNEITLTVQ